MLATAGRPRAHGPPGLLGLERLRPLKLEVLRRSRPLKLLTAGLQDRLAIGWVCQLLERHFPGQADNYGNVLAIPDWRPVMGDLYGLIEEAGWFEVDRGWWHNLQTGDLSLEDALECPPVQLYGYDEEHFEYGQPLRLMQILLEPFSVPYWGEEFGPLNVDDLEAWTQANSDRLAAWARLERIEEGPALYPEPPRRERDERLRRLPELARWVCHRTGNPILDNIVCECGYQHVWSWNANLAAIKPDWRQARSAVVKIRGLLEGLEEWYRADGRCLSTIAGVLMEDGNG